MQHFRSLVVSGALLLTTLHSLQAGSPTDPNWPCVQRKVPEISLGMIWTGPIPSEEEAQRWLTDPEVSNLIAAISSRRTPLPAVQEQLQQHLAPINATNRSIQLQWIISGTLASINLERDRIIEKIEGFTQQQRQLGQQVEELGRQIRSFPAGANPELDPELKDLYAKHYWFKRTFEQREQSLSYICEQPVLLEQRAFAIGRQLMTYLENPS